MKLAPELTQHFGAEEPLLWVGQPQPHVFAESGLMSIFYGVTWVVLGSFWYYGSGGIGEMSAFDGWWRLMPLGSLPFILAGLSFFYYPWKMARKAARSWYVVTTQRALIAEVLAGSATPRLRIFQPGEVAPPWDRTRWDRLHDLILTRRMQEESHLPTLLDSGFLGLSATQAQAALKALAQLPIFSPSKAAQSHTF